MEAESIAASAVASLTRTLFALGPLTGVRVLEFGGFLSGPIAGRILGDFGAEVIKVEPPKLGDQNRAWGKQDGGTSYSWYLQGRNKKSITCDLRTVKGQEIARCLAAKSNIVIENFRPGRMAAWGLGYGRLSAANKKLVMLHISGFGQDGPYRDRAGFGSVCEAMGGARYLTGEPGRPSVRTGFALGDSVTGIYGAFAAVAALRAAEMSGEGQEIDVAISEAVMTLLDDVILDYSGTGQVRQPQGAAINAAVPSNTYPTADGRPVVIGGNSDAVFRRLMRFIGRPDIAADPEYSDNAARARRAEELDGLIAEWTQQHTAEEAVELLNAEGVPASVIYTAADLVHDQHYRMRETIARVYIPQAGRALDMQGVVPKFRTTPGSIRWPGPRLGEHNHEVYTKVLGLNDGQLTELEQQGVI